MINNQKNHMLRHNKCDAKYKKNGWAEIIFFALITIGIAFGLRMLEWPCWQNPEYRLDNEMLLATHDAYHWLAGACGFGLAVDHPMSIMLAYMAKITNIIPANIAFWFPAVLASLVAGMTYIWVCSLEGICGKYQYIEKKGPVYRLFVWLGNLFKRNTDKINIDQNNDENYKIYNSINLNQYPQNSVQVGVIAGLIASIAPGFLGRTLLGYYDTDLITLFFPLLISIAPACWAMRFLLRPGMAAARLTRIFYKKRHEKNISKYLNFNLPSGDPLSFGWIVFLSLSGLIAFLSSQWHSVFPYIIRYDILLLVAMTIIMAPKARLRLLLSGTLTYILPSLAGIAGLIYPALIILSKIINHFKKSASGNFGGILANSFVLIALFCLSVWLIAQGDIYNAIINHINAYVKQSGDIHASAGVPLVFPSVSQSIIEVQDLSFAALFSYFHPWLEASLLGMIGFLIVVYKRPGALFLLPLATLGLLSSKLGGRMVMFGAPIVAIGISLPIFWLLRWLFASIISSQKISWLTCILLGAVLVAPFTDMIPALSQGPVINRRHAAALAKVSSITPPDSMLWIWWDWGYAAQYFARRATIADGARHGGPSLYLPAAIFATESPRFARQIIKYLSEKDNEPGNFFKGLNAYAAQELINKLQSTETPLVTGQGRQFIIVSFEMLRLGFWISNFGNWNFILRQGEGGALSIVTQSIAYKLNGGEVRLADSSNIIFPISINVFNETGLIKRNYVQEWFDAHPGATTAQKRDFLSTRRNINFLFNRVTDEKLVVDERLYNSLMTRLLLCDPGDPKISPYFKLVYDNVFARIYEVIP